MNTILYIPSVGAALLSSICSFIKFQNFWYIYNLLLCRNLAENFYKKKKNSIAIDPNLKKVWIF